MDLVNRIAGTESLAYYEDTMVCRLIQRLVDIRDEQLFVFHKAVHTLTDHTQTFLNSLFKCAADSHHLSYRLHAGTQFAGNAMEFTQVPTRYLADHIVECRFKEGTGRFRYRVLQVEQAVA